MGHHRTTHAAKLLVVHKAVLLLTGPCIGKRSHLSCYLRAGANIQRSIVQAITQMLHTANTTDNIVNVPIDSPSEAIWIGTCLFHRLGSAYLQPSGLVSWFRLNSRSWSDLSGHKLVAIVIDSFGGGIICLNWRFLLSLIVKVSLFLNEC